MANLKNFDEKYFDEIDKDLTLARVGFLKSEKFSYHEIAIREEDQARLILGSIKEIHKLLSALFAEFPSLEFIFEQEFGSLSEFSRLETILENCFFEETLFPEKTRLPAIEVQSNVEEIRNWCEINKKLHQETNVLLTENFHFEVHSKDLPCKCQNCISDYRNRLRELIFSNCEELIDETHEWMLENVTNDSINNVTRRVSNLKQAIDRKLNSVKYRVKRATLNKIEIQVKALLKQYFNYDSEIGLKFTERLKEIYREHLKTQGLRRDLISDEEYNRFFSQLGFNLWKDERFQLREFTKLVQAVLSLKRKDISANILREYLGQFWLHAEARKMNRKIIYHMGPTNSGKTYHAIQALAKVKKGCYLAPLRLLASELYDTLTSKGVATTLLTGEEVIEVPGATHYSSTIEMAKLKDNFDCCVIDEIQMLTDPQRGWAWTRALVGMKATEIHVCGDNTVEELINKIVKLNGDTLEIIRYERMTELKVMDVPVSLGELERGDALIVFSRRNALKYKADLEALSFKVSIVYGRLSPEVRREQARKFDEGETDIIVSTDAISMGMNLPIQRIIFSTLTKYIDDKECPISPSEIKQISGRAGRFKRFPIGYVSCLTREREGLNRIKDSLKMTLKQSEVAMVGPDLEIFEQVNSALNSHSLPILKLSEFLRLFNTMTFSKPFFCVDLREMIELAEMVEEADANHNSLSSAEIFGFACSPVNLGLMEHVQYYVWILNNYVNGNSIKNDEIDSKSDNIDYLETAIKCVELYQWLSRHFQKKNFIFSETDLLNNKSLAIERLNELLSEKTVKSCSSCGKALLPNLKFNICDECFQKRKRGYRENRDRERDFRDGRGGRSGRDNNRGYSKKRR
ncbi:MAG: helicase-related protein [Bacteriovoracaceae bacterium]